MGPDLTAIGTTLSTERIIEELLWPARQIKEGYSVVAVVTDSGNLFSHASIAAREFGIPAVVGCTGATRRFTTGQQLTVDGSKGTVTTLG